MTPDKVAIAIMMTLALHNMFLTKLSESYNATGFVDFKIPNGNVIQGEWHACSIPNLAPLQWENGERQSFFWETS